MAGSNHTANAVGSLFVLQRHIARRPTLGNAKHIGGARRRSLFGGALVCIVCAGRDAVPLSVRPSIACEGPSLGPNRDLLLLYYYYYYYYFTYLPTYWISVLLRCAVRHPGWLARSLLPEQSPLRWHAQANQTTNNVGPLRRWHVIADMPEPLLARPAPVATEWRRQQLERAQIARPCPYVASETLAHCLIFQYYIVQV